MDEVAGALADPVRREILLMLRDETLTAGQIAGRFSISRPAVSRHLRVLRDAGLVHDTADGRRRVYTLDTGPLEELTGWLGRLTRPSGWQHHFDALETEVHRTRRSRLAGERLAKEGLAGARDRLGGDRLAGDRLAEVKPLTEETA
ncbi:metalloregulator ArsR/SmtB family transcription factor [Actinoplanes utahensis]|uniref:metalloregulator ArsR/SmtB family transcription factor n=1 Tax=Actinoplanes utahensis TaxID=1869 RepID=UPI0009FDA911|nr:metalloregulator ArsR/SmtB family transcription factor [Actinoplanes utahensis]